MDSSQHDPRWASSSAASSSSASRVSELETTAGTSAASASSAQESVPDLECDIVDVTRPLAQNEDERLPWLTNELDSSSDSEGGGEETPDVDLAPKEVKGILGPSQVFASVATGEANGEVIFSPHDLAVATLTIWAQTPHAGEGLTAVIRYLGKAVACVLI